MDTINVKQISTASRRIARDYKEFLSSPIANVSVCFPDESNLFLLHANVKILNGIYEGIILHLIMHIPYDYPLTGPSMNIAPGINFGHEFHEHVFEDPKHGNSICNDLLTNFAFFFQGDKKTAVGWSPGYTISTILLQMSIFFENPDFPEKFMPSTAKIAKLKSDLNEFCCKECGHKTIMPYPEFSGTIQSPEDIQQEILKGKITCCVTKKNIIDDGDVSLGCPLNIKIENEKRIIVPLLEIISYETFAREIQKNEGKLDSYSTTFFTSANGHPYNFIIPFYLTKEHFARNKQLINNSISVIKYGTAEGTEKYNFKPIDAFDVLLLLCNKTIINILDNQLHESRMAVEMYIQFLRLLIEYIREYPELKQVMDEKISNFKKFESKRNKLCVPDLGEFIILLFLAKVKYGEVRQPLMEEFFARQALWLRREKVKYNHDNIATDTCLKNYFESRKLSCRLFVFNIYMAEKLIFRECAIDELDKRYGFPEESVLDGFISQIIKIKTELVSLEQFIRAVRCNDIINDKAKMYKFIKYGDIVSDRQGYTIPYKPKKYNKTGPRK
jgi:ubiquitin-protein ligase